MNLVFNRQPKESPDALANRLQKEGKIANLETELQRYSVSTLTAKDKERYFHLWGITAFQRQDRAEAFRRFKEGLETCPDSQNLLFSLGQEYEYRREIDRMFDCFDRCSFPKSSSAFMLAAARYAYLWDRPDKGAGYTRRIIRKHMEQHFGGLTDNAIRAGAQLFGVSPGDFRSGIEGDVRRTRYRGSGGFQNRLARA